MLFDDGFTFRNFVADAFAVFMFVLWFWLFVSVASDLFRRHAISGSMSAASRIPYRHENLALVLSISWSGKRNFAG